MKPTADVRLSVAAQGAAAQMDQFMQQLKSAMGQLQGATGGVGKKAKETGWSFGTWFKNIGKAALAIELMQLPMKAVYFTAELVTKELEKQIELSKQAGERQVPYGAAMSNLVHSMPNSEDPKLLMEKIDSMVKESSVRDKTALLGIIEAGASSTSGMPYEQRAQIAVKVAEMRPDLMLSDPAALQNYVKSNVIAMSTFEGHGATPESIQGLHQAALTSSAVGDPEKFAKEIASFPAKAYSAFSSISPNYNQLELLQFISGISTAAQDTDGAISHTAGMNFLAQINEQFKSRGMDDVRKMGLNEQRDFLRGEDPRMKSMRSYLLGALNAEYDLSAEEESQIRNAQKDPAAIAKLRGRAKTKFVMMQLIQPRGTADTDGSFNSILKSTGSELPGSYEEAANYINKRINIVEKSDATQEFRLKDFVDKSVEGAAFNRSGSWAAMFEDGWFDEFMTDVAGQSTSARRAQRWNTTLIGMAGGNDRRQNEVENFRSMQTQIRQRMVELEKHDDFYKGGHQGFVDIYKDGISEREAQLFQNNGINPTALRQVRAMAELYSILQGEIDSQTKPIEVVDKKPKLTPTKEAGGELP